MGDWFYQAGQPDKFVNMTNGVTPRRWIRCANAPLAEVVSKWMGNDLWIKDLSKMSGLLQSKGNQKLKDCNVIRCDQLIN